MRWKVFVSYLWEIDWNVNVAKIVKREIFLSANPGFDISILSHMEITNWSDLLGDWRNTFNHQNDVAFNHDFITAIFFCLSVHCCSIFMNEESVIVAISMCSIKTYQPTTSLSISMPSSLTFQNRPEIKRSRSKLTKAISAFAYPPIKCSWNTSKLMKSSISVRQSVLCRWP